MMDTGAKILLDVQKIIADHAPNPVHPVDNETRTDMLLNVLAYLLREPFLHKPQGGNSCELARTKRAGGAE